MSRRHFPTDGFAVIEEARLSLRHIDSEQVDALAYKYLLSHRTLLFDPVTYEIASREKFFKGSRTLISLTPMERQRKIFIPGHRFFPFYDRSKPPYAVNFKFGDVTFNRIKTQINFQEAMIYYSFFSVQDMIDLLFLEDKRNYEILANDKESNAEVFIYAWDFSEIIDKVPPNAFLRATLKSWTDARFELDVFTPKNTRAYQEKQTAWCEDLEQSISEILTLLPERTEIYDQLARAFYSGPAHLRQQPQLHLGGFIRNLSYLDFIRREGVPQMWDAALPMAEFHLEILKPTAILENAMESLDQIFTDIGISVVVPILASYMKDAHYRGRPELQEVMARVYGNRPPVTFASPEQEHLAQTMTLDLWEEVSRNYNRFKDKRLGKVRNSYLQILDQANMWVRSSVGQIELDQLPQEETMALSGLVTMLGQMIALLESGQDQLELTEIRSCEESLGPIFSQTQEILANLNQSKATLTKPAAATRPVFRVIQGGLSEKSQ